MTASEKTMVLEKAVAAIRRKQDARRDSLQKLEAGRKMSAWDKSHGVGVLDGLDAAADLLEGMIAELEAEADTDAEDAEEERA